MATNGARLTLGRQLIFSCLFLLLEIQIVFFTFFLVYQLLRHYKVLISKADTVWTATVVNFI